MRASSAVTHLDPTPPAPPFLRGGMSLIRQRLDADVLVVRHALGVVGLDGEAPLAEFVARSGDSGWLDIFKQLLIVDPHCDLLPFDGDMVGVPLIVLDGAAEDFD